MSEPTTASIHTENAGSADSSATGIPVAPQASETTGFLPPRKVILTKEQLEAFQQSKTHETIVSYINALNECVVGVKLTDELAVSPVRKSAWASSPLCGLSS